jgi:hypothetical protein
MYNTTLCVLLLEHHVLQLLRFGKLGFDFGDEGREVLGILAEFSIGDGWWVVGNVPPQAWSAVPSGGAGA